MTKNNSRFKKYKLKRKEEVKYFNNINNLLKNYEKDLKSISTENNEYNIILHGHKICELMLELTLKKEGHSPPNITPIIQYSMTTKIFSHNCKSHLQKIKMIRNKVVHEKNPNPNMSYNFLISFDYFIMWFNDYYDSHLLIRNDLKIEKYHNLIKSILQNQDITVQHNIEPQTDNNFELDYIIEINKLLKEYEKEIKLIPDENANYVIIFSGLRICDLMIELYLKENDYSVNNNVVTEKRKRIPLISYCIINHIFPDECEKFLILIRKYRNEAVHSGITPSNELILSFLNAFDSFLSWFNNYYSIECNVEKQFNIDECHYKIYLLNKNQEKNSNRTPVFYSRGEEQSEVMNETSTNLNSQIYLKMNPVDYNTNQVTLEDIAKKLDKNSETAMKILEKVLNTEETTKRIENTLDAINKKISELSNQIMGLQSFTERYIEKAISEEDVDRIIETFTDECADKLVQHVNTTKQDYIYNTEQKKLMFSLGENAWNKLSEESKTFLITSKVTYNNMINIDSIIDYSGICVLVTKALEVETKKRFFSNFLNYLDKQYNEDYSKYHTALLYKNEKPLFIEKFNMGDIAFVMCYKENWYDTEDQKINNKSKLIEYCKSCVFSKYEENEIENLLTKYASSIEEIRKNYRNPSAHTNNIQRTDADECFDLILDVEKLLKQMLDSFDF